MLQTDKLNTYDVYYWNGIGVQLDDIFADAYTERQRDYIRKEITNRLLEEKKPSEVEEGYQFTVHIEQPGRLGFSRSDVVVDQDSL